MELPETTKNITVLWLNEVLHENGFLGSANIVSLKREPMGVGAGFMSDMAKLTLSFDRDTQHLPKTMIAKLLPSYPSARELAIRLNYFEREIRFYTELAPESPIRTPELIYGAMDSENKRYVMIMEDCSYCTPADQQQGLTYEQTKIVVSKMADFHARWWDDENLDSLQWMPTQKNQVTANIDMMRASWDACAKIEEFRKALPEGGWEAGLKICEQRPWLVKSIPGDKLTIIHSDLRADNIFFDWDTPDNPLILFDWSSAVVGHGVTELPHLLASSLATELRRQVEKDIVKLYYEHLLARGVSSYTFDECWTDYLRGFLIKIGAFMAGLSIVDYSDPRSLKSITTGLHRWFSAILDNKATSMLP